MAHVPANLVGFHTNLKEYLAAEKYADVTIECQENIFKCHRVILAMASNFFDTMFNSKFKESADSKVALPETNAETFAEVVQFIYTGDVSVTSSNVNNLLEASEFFGLSGISDLCTTFIENHKIGVQKTLSAFLFACKTSKQVLIERLSEDIVEHFKIFSRVDEFLEIPFEGLRTILSQWSSPNTEEVKIGAIVRWVSHNQKGRIQHIYDLVEMIRFGNITSNEYIRLVFAKLWAEPNSAGSLTESLKPVGLNDILEAPRNTGSEKSFIRVYVRSGEKEDSVRVCSLNKEGNRLTVSPAKHLLKSSPYQWFKSVALDDHLYRLDYCRKGPNAEPSDQAFSVHTLADMMGPSLSLMPPPLVFGDVSFCALGNNIYAYHRTSLRQLVRANSENLTRFDDEEINRGVYIYNCELDNWFSVPAMKKQLQESCMVSWNDQILYLIDGSNDEGQAYCVKYLQAYDCRVGKWQELPASTSYGNYTNCCVHDGKIYVCNGDHTYFDRFDPTACKWETLGLNPQINPRMGFHQLVSYSNKLGAVGSYGEGVHATNLSVQFCSFQTSVPRQGRKAVVDMSWSSSSSWKLVSVDYTTAIVVDIVVF